MEYRLIKVNIEKAVEEESFHMHRKRFSTHSRKNFYEFLRDIYNNISGLEDYSVLILCPIQGLSMVSARKWFLVNSADFIT